MVEYKEKEIIITDGSSFNDFSILKNDSYNKLTVTGIKQEKFESFINQLPKNISELSLFKCPLISDLSPLEGLDFIESINIYWNQRVDTLWSLKNNKKLKALVFDDFTRLRNLDDLTTTSTIENLTFGNRVWDKLVLETLEPLVEVQSLKHLNFSAKKIEDRRISPISCLKSLEEINFKGNLFTTEQVAWLKSKLPRDIESNMLKAYRMIEDGINLGDQVIDTFVIGKRKPSLDSSVDVKRIANYKKKFDELVSLYRSSPNIPEPIPAK